MRQSSLPFLILVCLVALFAAPTLASAATAQQVIKDWQADYSIDGDYTLSELRAANAQIPSAQREYYNWDEAYAAAVQRVTHPGKVVKTPPPVVKPHDANGNGTIDPAETDAAKQATAAAQKKFFAHAEPDAASTNDGQTPTTADSVKTKASDSSDGDDDGAPWALIVVGVLLVLALAVGVWRAARGSRGDGDGGPEDDRRP